MTRVSKIISFDEFFTYLVKFSVMRFNSDEQSEAKKVGIISAKIQIF